MDPKITRGPYSDYILDPQWTWLKKGGRIHRVDQNEIALALSGARNESIIREKTRQFAYAKFVEHKGSGINARDASDLRKLILWGEFVFPEARRRLARPLNK